MALQKQREVTQLHTHSKEASWLLIIMICAKVVFTDIMIFVRASGTAAHLQALWCILIQWIIFLVSYFFFKKCKSEDIFGCIRRASGKAGLMIWGIVVYTLEIINLASILKIYSETLSSLTLTTSPIWYLSGFIIICMLFAVYSSPRGLFGVCTGFGVVILSLFGLIALLDIPHYDMTNIFPVLGNGPKSIFAGISGVTIFNDLFFLYYLSGNLRDKKSVKKVGIKVLSVTSFITFISTLLYTFAVPYPLSERFYMPVFQISSDITYDVVIQRAEALFLIMWILTIFIYMSAHLYFALITFKNTFNSSNQKAIVPISLSIIISLGSLWQNINQASPVSNLVKILSATIYWTVAIISFVICSIKDKKEDISD